MRLKEAIKNSVPSVLRDLVCKDARPPRESSGHERFDEQLGRVIDYTIGPYTIVLPHYHALPRYQAKWKLYDSTLSVVSKALESKYSSFSSIDIGANVGDTAAAISCGPSTPVLCIEGDPSYIPFLQRNAATIGSQVTVELCYVASSAGVVTESQLVRQTGTTSAASALSAMPGHATSRHSIDGIKVQRLESILEHYPGFSTPRLIKIDTDGFDFAIISSHTGWIGSRHPVIYFEYVIDSKTAHEEALNCIKSLADCGYTQFLVFDNFGNLLNSHAHEADFPDINMYLLSNRAFGKRVCYCDVLALPEAESDVAVSIREVVSRKVFSAIEGS